MRRTRRRRFVLAAAALAAAPLVRAQAPAGMRTLGVLSPHPLPPPQFIADNPFTNRLRALGWVEGRTLRIERAYAEGREDLLPELAEGLVRKRVDVIWASGFVATRSAMVATKTIPIVFWGVQYPVEQGVVESLSRPGGNVTGVTFTASSEARAKVIELLRDIAPAARRLASVTAPSANQSLAGQQTELTSRTIEAAATRLGFDVREFHVERVEDLDRVFAAVIDWRADALTAGSTSVTFRERSRLAAFANRQRLPNAYTQRVFVEAGGLVSYGLQMADSLERTTDLVDRILRGASVAVLPVELPTKYELAVNLKSAAAIGVVVPQSLLLRADRVIE